MEKSYEYSKNIIDDFDHAIKLDPKNHQAFNNRGFYKANILLDF